ncbi:MAG: trigger factor [Flavobacteriales bacterium]|nr:trigger factor [Flavobacteriales bacterium]
MNIVQENIDRLNAKLKIVLSPDDYATQYDTALRSYRKQMNMPGFRPGTIPMGVVKKKVGRHLLAEEINKVLSESIYKYITENKIDVLGTPLPLAEGEKGDWDDPKDFEFEYELGLAPELDVKVSSKDKVKYYIIKVDDKMIDQEVERMQKMYGKLMDAEVSSDEDVIKGVFVELDENGDIKEGGIMNESSVGLNYIENEDLKKQLTGIKIGDTVDLDPEHITSNHGELGRILNITHDQVHDLNTKFKFTIKEIKHVELSEINQELFDKIYGEGNVNSIDEMKAKIKAQLDDAYVTESDRMFMRDASDHFISKHKVQLPDEFLKRWIQRSSEKPVTPEQVEQDYNNYAMSLKWQLITNEMIKNFGLKLEEDEVLNEAKSLIVRNYAQYGYPSPADEELQETAVRVLQNQDERKKLVDAIFDRKIKDYLKENMKLSEKEVSFDKFVELAKK